MPESLLDKISLSRVTVEKLYWGRKWSETQSLHWNTNLGTTVIKINWNQYDHDSSQYAKEKLRIVLMMEKYRKTAAHLILLLTKKNINQHIILCWLKNLLRS